jgi:DNA-binding XRE family transcriptional regulator
MMAGHRSFKDVRERRARSAEQEARVAQIRRAYGDILRLADLRAARGVTQAELADELAVSQTNISRLEREQDLYLSTLGSYILGLGGELRIEAVFPEGTYTLMELRPDVVEGVRSSTVS